MATMEEEEDASQQVMTMLTMELAEEEEEDCVIRLEVMTTTVTMGPTSSTSRIISKEILVPYITMAPEELEFTPIEDLDKLEILYNNANPSCIILSY